MSSLSLSWSSSLSRLNNHGAKATLNFFFALLLVLLSSASSSLASASGSSSLISARRLQPSSSALSLSEFSKYLNTDVRSEFGVKDDATAASRHWADAMDFQWERCRELDRDEQQQQQLQQANDTASDAGGSEGRKVRCQYVICIRSGGAGGGGGDEKKDQKSGYARRQKLIDAVKAAAASSGVDEEHEPIFQAIYNGVHDEAGVGEGGEGVGEDIWCGSTSLSASVASSIACGADAGANGIGDECLVTPAIASMKMMPSMVDRLMGEMAKYEKDSGDDDQAAKVAAAASASGSEESVAETGGTKGRNFPVADITLCPGVIVRDDVDKVIAAVAAMGSEEGGGGYGDGDGGMADAVSSAVELDITKKITSWMLAKKSASTSGGTGGGGEDGENATSMVVESDYWSHASKSGGDVTERGKFWSETLASALGSDMCSDVYSNRLRWTATHLSVDDASAISVTFGAPSSTTMTEAEMAVDRRCVLALWGALALHPDVCSIDVRPEFKASNRHAQWLVQTGVEETRPWFDDGVNLDGRGQIVAVSDTGIDVNNCYFWDSTTSISFQALDDSHRKIVQYLPFVDTSDVAYGHGTHVVGTVAGRRAIQGTTESTGWGDGIARGAKIAFADIGTSSGSLSIPSEQFLLSTGRTGGISLSSGSDLVARIHSGSWGAPGVNFYNGQARNFDSFMFDNDDLLINMAAGNSGRGNARSTVGAPSTFKNGIAVGSSQSFGEDLTSNMLGPAFVSSFSSRGPTADGRIKPDVIAPGHFLVSAGGIPTVTGECDGGFLPPPSGRSAGLLSLAGTSMATPVVSGTAAMIRQYFEEGWYPDGRIGSGEVMNPSGALVKAVLMNGARTNMIGVDNGDIGAGVTPVSPYDNTIGFGRISLTTSLYIEGKTDVQAQVWDRELITPGEEREFDVTINRSNGCTFPSLSVTLVWVERPSVTGCSRCLLNDLDLHVTEANGDGTIYFPNGLGRRDAINTAERVVLSNVTDGKTFTLHVTGTNLDDSSQRFALVATGCFGGVANSVDTNDTVFDQSTEGFTFTSSAPSRTAGAWLVLFVISTAAAAAVSFTQWW